MNRLALALGLAFLGTAATSQAADVGRHSAPSAKYFAEDYQPQYTATSGPYSNYTAPVGPVGPGYYGGYGEMGAGYRHGHHRRVANTPCYDCNCAHPIFRTKASGLQLAPVFHYHRGFRRYMHGNHCCGDIWTGYCAHGPHADLGLFSGGRPHGRSACLSHDVRGFRGRHGGGHACGRHGAGCPGQGCVGQGCGESYYGGYAPGYEGQTGPMYYDVEPSHDAQEVQPIIEAPQPEVRETRRLLVIPAAMVRNPHN